MSGLRWGIALEWDFGGLACTLWACHLFNMRPMHFATEEEAQEYIDETLEPPSERDIDVMATPRQFS